MITVYYGRAQQLVDQIGENTCLTKIEKQRKEKILHTGNEKSQVCSLATGMLLHLALCEYLGLKAEKTAPFRIDSKKERKPYLTDYPAVFYNLSHSGEYVCCAVGDAELGVDIQKHVPVKDGLAERFFTEKDKQMLAEACRSSAEKQLSEFGRSNLQKQLPERCSSNAGEQLFFRMWSIKESYVKFTGLGMKQGLNSFEIDWKNKSILDLEGKRTAAFEEFVGLPGYSLSLCRENCRTEVSWKEVEEGWNI